MKFNLKQNKDHAVLYDEDKKRLGYLERYDVEWLAFQCEILLKAMDDHSGEHGCDDWMTEKEEA